MKRWLPVIAVILAVTCFQAVRLGSQFYSEWQVIKASVQQTQDQFNELLKVTTNVMQKVQGFLDRAKPLLRELENDETSNGDRGRTGLVGGDDDEQDRAESSKL